jgi:hypothetical protein
MDESQDLAHQEFVIKTTASTMYLGGYLFSVTEILI